MQAVQVGMGLLLAALSFVATSQTTKKAETVSAPASSSASPSASEPLQGQGQGQDADKVDRAPVASKRTKPVFDPFADAHAIMDKERQFHLLQTQGAFDDVRPDKKEAPSHE